MCQGTAIFANNKRALYAKKTVSHDKGATELRINGDKYRKFEYLWWKKKLNQVHYDDIARAVLKEIDRKKAFKLANQLVKKNLKTQNQLAKWLKGVPEEWDKLLNPEFRGLARKVNPKLVLYADRIARFKKEKIERYNPYQATKLPALKELKKYRKLDQVWDQVWDQVGDQVWDQVGDQVWDQVWDQVRDQVGDQVRDQVWATSYWAVKVVLGLPIKHWFFDFLKLGVMVVFVKGKVKVFGKKGKFLGEYDESELK